MSREAGSSVSYALQSDVTQESTGLIDDVDGLEGILARFLQAVFDVGIEVSRHFFHT